MEKHWVRNGPSRASRFDPQVCPTAPRLGYLSSRSGIDAGESLQFRQPSATRCASVHGWKDSTKLRTVIRSKSSGRRPRPGKVSADAGISRHVTMAEIRAAVAYLRADSDSPYPEGPVTIRTGGFDSCPVEFHAHCGAWLCTHGN